MTQKSCYPKEYDAQYKTGTRLKTIRPNEGKLTQDLDSTERGWVKRTAVAWGGGQTGQLTKGEEVVGD